MDNNETTFDLAQRALELALQDLDEARHATSFRRRALRLFHAKRLVSLASRDIQALYLESETDDEASEGT